MDQSVARQTDEARNVFGDLLTMPDGSNIASGYCFQREIFHDVIVEGMPLLVRQWQEAGEPGAGSLAMAEDRYAAMERAGMLRVFTTRRAGQLVGHATFFVFTGMHAAVRAAVLDALYLFPEHRGPRVSLRLVRHAETALQAEGVGIIHMHANERFLGFARLLQSLGYHPVSRTLAKVLNDA